MPGIDGDRLTVKHLDADTAAVEVHQKTAGANNADAMIVRQWGTSGNGRALVVRSDNASQPAVYVEGDVTATGTVTSSGASLASVNVTGALTSTDAVTAKVTGDTHSRFIINAGGGVDLGPGNGAVDTNFYRGDVNLLQTDSNFTVGGALSAPALKVTEGANARMGVAVLVGGTVTVPNTTVTASTRIFLTTQEPGGTPGWVHVSARVADTSFTILSSSATDTSTVAWLLVAPA